MKTKTTILTLAIIAALPFTAHATQTIVETNTPAAVGANGTVKKAAATGPYQTATIGEHDDEHIATTAYVKGAYNDAIAAVNKVNDSKQEKMNVVGANDDVVSALYQWEGGGFYDEIMGGLLPDIEQDFGIDYSDSLITAEAAVRLYAILAEYKQQKLDVVVNDQVQDIDIDSVVQSINTTNPSATSLVNEVAVANAINGQATALNNKRVRIYTTWGTDTAAATTLVPFETAQQ